MARHRSRPFASRQRDARAGQPSPARSLHQSTAKDRQFASQQTCTSTRSFARRSSLQSPRGKTAKILAAEAFMKAVLALVIIYVAMFFLAIQGASQNSAQPQGGTGQTGHSIDPAKEADIRSLMELVGARDAMQDFAAHGADQIRENLLASVPASDRGQQFVNAFIEGYRAKFNPDNATAQLVTIYDQHFTQDEIKGLLQFYGSPLGQKFAAEMPKINLEMQAANRAFSMRIAKDVLQDLRKQYPGVAARARLAKPRQGQVEQAQQQAQTQPTQP
jgi:hypothetical protein